MDTYKCRDRERKDYIMRDSKMFNTVPADTLILGDNQYYSKDCYKTRLNNNVLVVGTSGAGKTRSIVIPNLLQASGNYVISDPKGYLSKKYGDYMKSKGYRVLNMDFIHPEKSLRYNPIHYCSNSTEVVRLAHMLVQNVYVKGATKTIDPFWDEASELLISACIGYLVETDQIEESKKNFSSLVDMIRKCKREYMEVRNGKVKSRLEIMMEEHKRYMKTIGKESWAAKKFEEFNVCPDKTYSTVNITSIAKMTSFDTVEINKMMETNDIDFTTIGTEPTVVFVEVSDTDRSMDLLVNLFYSQLMNSLCSFADEKCEDGRLPIPVQFILDDFATNARIDNFENMIANIRSRNISAMLMVQSEAQLAAGYYESAPTIIDNCNTYVYMGGSSPDMASQIAKRANKTTNTILNMPIQKSWIFRRGQAPVCCDNFKLEPFELEKRRDEVTLEPEIN